MVADTTNGGHIWSYNNYELSNSKLVGMIVSVHACGRIVVQYTQDKPKSIFNFLNYYILQFCNIWFINQFEVFQILHNLDFNTAFPKSFMHKCSFMWILWRCRIKIRVAAFVTLARHWSATSVYNLMKLVYVGSKAYILTCAQHLSMDLWNASKNKRTHIAIKLITSRTANICLNFTVFFCYFTVFKMAGNFHPKAFCLFDSTRLR